MKQQDKQGAKQIKVSTDIHKNIKLLAAKEGREMREIVETAYQFYIENRAKEER